MPPPTKSRGLAQWGRLDCSGARKAGSGEHFFDLRAVPVAMGGDQEQPLIAIEIAKRAMGEEMLPRICS